MEHVKWFMGGCLVFVVAMIAFAIVGDVYMAKHKTQTRQIDKPKPDWHIVTLPDTLPWLGSGPPMAGMVVPLVLMWDSEKWEVYEDAGSFGDTTKAESCEGPYYYFDSQGKAHCAKPQPHK